MGSRKFRARSEPIFLGGDERSSTKTGPRSDVSKPSFSDLALATYCPRKLYYRRRESDRSPPAGVTPIRDLAFQYPDLLDPGGSKRLESAPIEVTPTEYRTNLGRARASLDAWPDLAEPPARDVYLDGRTCRGVAHKVLETPLAPSIVSPGRPPSDGVWRPQSVRAVAAAKALSWERETIVPRAFVEYPAHGVIREVRLTTRRKAVYHHALRTVRSIDGPPPRIHDDAKCSVCEYRDECGVRTRTLRSHLG